MYLLTFADKRYSRTLTRIGQEALALPFEGVFAWDEDEIPQEVFLRKKAFFVASRGFGYWLWKPLLILKALEKLPEEGALLYCDAGCQLNREGSRRLREYETLARHDGVGVLAFELGRVHTNYRWTKMDTLLRIGGSGTEVQMTAGFSVYINTPKSRLFVQEWLSICEEDNHHFLDDTPSSAANHPTFVEHRHDQSIFSLIVRKYRITSIPDESYWGEPPTWHLRKMFPVHARRLKI